MKKKIIIGIVATAILVVAVGSARMLLGAFDIDETTYLYVMQDDNIRSVGERLGKDSGFSRDAELSLLGRINGKIHTGRYRIEKGMSVVRLWRNLTKGNQEPLNLTIPSVRTKDKLASYLSSKLLADSCEIENILNDSAKCAEYGFSCEDIICMFVPNTYQVYWNISTDDLMKRMKKEYDSFWNNERTAKAKSAGMTPNEVMTLASIVDEETANNGEKPKVAGMYINRLKQGMPLQADPTIKFALGQFELKRIYHNMLTVKSPYNTYVNTGLPPGPIRIPSVAGIDAVLNYVHHDYLYMCAKEDLSGTHNFAVTYTEHLQNAKRYADALQKLGIK